MKSTDILNQLDPPDPRDKMLSTSSIPGPLSDMPEWTIEEQMPVPKFQWSQNCRAHGLISVFEQRWRAETNTWRVFSPAFLYFCARQLAKKPAWDIEIGDFAPYPRDICKALCVFGCCEEWMCPETQTSLVLEPPTHAFAQAQRFRAVEYKRVAPELVKIALRAGYSMTIDVTLYAHWHDSDVWSGQRDTMLAPSGISSEIHAMALCGYSDIRQCWRIKNSWGRVWGNGGYAWLPYSYTEQGVAWIGWTITKIAGKDVEGGAV